MKKYISILKLLLEKLKYNHLATGSSYKVLTWKFLASKVFQPDILNIYFLNEEDTCFCLVSQRHKDVERMYKTFSILSDLIQLYFQIYIILNLDKTIPRALSGFKSIWSMILAADSSVMHFSTF